MPERNESESSGKEATKNSFQIATPAITMPKGCEVVRGMGREIFRESQYGGLHFNLKNIAALGVEVVPANQPVTWRLKMARPGGGNLQPGDVEDLILVLGYEWA